MLRFGCAAAPWLAVVLLSGCGGAVNDDEQGPITAPPDMYALSALHASGDVCARWAADRAHLEEGQWTGSVVTCTAGTITDPGRENALRQINSYRWLAGRAPVIDDASMSASAQACALVMDATGDIDHFPEPTASCYTSAAADAAAHSNLVSDPGVFAIDQYMLDKGDTNARRMGHRRWLLADRLTRVGLGSTSAASCLFVQDGSVANDFQIRTWPAPGAFPSGAYRPRDNLPSLDQTGWTIEASFALDAARVEVWENGRARAVSVNQLEPAAQSLHGLRWIPNGWRARAGATYTIAVTGVAVPFRYDVTLVDCG